MMICIDCKNFQQVDQDYEAFRRCFFDGKVFAYMNYKDDTATSSPEWCPLPTGRLKSGNFPERKH